MSIALIRKAKRQAWQAIRDLKQIDRRLTALGCLEAHVHFKRRLNRHGETVVTNMMYLLEPQDRTTGRRPYTYIGIDQARQDEVLAQIERFEIRERLRGRITQLKRTYRTAERELATALAIYRALFVQARDCAREFAPYASSWDSTRAALSDQRATGATVVENA